MKHVFEYDKEKLTLEERKFIANTIKRAKEHNCIVKLINESGIVYGDNSKVNGYFSVEDNGSVLAVATKKAKSKWMKTLIHEACHMDQYIENAKIWNDVTIKEHYSAPDLLFTWADGVVELNAKQLKDYTMRTLLMELDCEKRSVAKIASYNLPYSVDEYAQRANAYVYFYLVVAKTRKWYAIGKEPYNIKEVWQAMPSHFVNDYTKLPKGAFSLYEKHCYR